MEEVIIEDEMGGTRFDDLDFEWYWDTQVKKGVDPSIDETFSMIFNVNIFEDGSEIRNRFIKYLGGPDVAIEKAKKLLTEAEPIGCSIDDYDFKVKYIDAVNTYYTTKGEITLDIEVGVDGIYLPENKPMVQHLKSCDEWEDFTYELQEEFYDYFYNVLFETGISIMVEVVSEL